MAAFSSNPLSLSVPEAEFESWLRDSGYLEILDQRTSDLHALSSTSSPSPQPSSSHRPASTAEDSSASTTANSATAFFFSLLSQAGILLSLFTLNPIAKLTTDDFSGDTPSWTHGFIGYSDSYSFPSSISQARMRLHENVKRYARNYASLLILFFACSLYQIPLALVGLVASLALWDAFRFCGARWGLDNYPVFRSSLVRVAQLATIAILFVSNVQMAIFCALGVSYAAVILHASFRKLTPVKPQARRR